MAEVTTPPSTLGILLAVALSCAGCDGRGVPDADQGSGAPRLALIDSIVLQEGDSAQLGNPENTFAIGSDGDVFVADQSLHQVFRYSAKGILKQRYGHDGSGPGEFGSTMSLTALADSLVIQATAGKFVAFALADGAFRYNRPHRRAYPASWSTVSDSVVIGLLDLVAGKAVAVIGRSTLGGREDGSLDNPLVPDRVDFPAEYLSHPQLQAFSTAHAAAWSDSMLVGFAGVPYVVRYTLSGTAVDTAWIPWVTRRGFPDGWLETFAAGKRVTLQAMVGAFSFLSGLWRLPDGSFVLWHQENAIDESFREPRFSGTAHISILSRDLQRACVDAPVPFPGTNLPRIALHGDTLYALDQVGDPATTSVVTVLRRYLVSADGCRWLPTIRVR